MSVYCQVTVIGSCFTLYGVGTKDGKSQLFTYNLETNEATMGKNLTDMDSKDLSAESAAMDPNGNLMVQDRAIASGIGYRLYEIDTETGKAISKTLPNKVSDNKDPVLMFDMAYENRDTNKMIVAVDGSDQVYISWDTESDAPAVCNYFDYWLEDPSSKIASVARGDVWYYYGMFEFTPFYCLDAANGVILRTDVGNLGGWKSLPGGAYDLDTELTFKKDANSRYQDSLIYNSALGCLLLFHYTADGTQVYAISLDDTNLSATTHGKANVALLGTIQGFEDVAIYNASYTAPENHTWSQWTVTKEATCTEDGEETRTCSDCGKTEARPIPALGHDFTVKGETVAPTCINEGYTVYKCSRCDATEHRDTVPATGEHTYGQWKETKAATCTEKGEKTRECAVCHDMETEEIPALGHDFSVKGETVAPTCINEGYTVYKCSRCDATEHRDIVPATGEHTYGQWKETKAATCTEKGEKTHECTICHNKETEEIPALGHDFSVKSETVAPTCTEVGYTVYQCIRCDATEHRDAVPAAGHTSEVKNAKEATCTEAGYSGDEICSVCGETLKKGQELPALGHDFSVKGETVAPTETEEGYTVYQCSRCDATEKRDIVPATGHKCASEAFTDLRVDQWYHPYTDYVIDNGLMKGMGGGKFVPNGTTTRAMLVTTLYRMAGEPEVTETSTFTDVHENQWYAKAVTWAQNNGIVKGVTDTAFCPNANIIREQAAAFLYRYVTLYLKQEPAEGADLSVYKDADKISNYAKEAIAWATAEGLFNGFENGTLQHKGPLTRVQMAKLLTVLDQKF